MCIAINIGMIVHLPLLVPPNDTHACRVRAFVRNEVVMRVEQNYDHQRITQTCMETSQRNWNPRMCLKGYTFHRRFMVLTG